MPVVKPQALVAERIDALRAFQQRVGTPRVELDMSGGVDSAVMLGLLAKAMGPENITTVHSRIHSNSEHLERAQETADAFSVPLVVVDLTDIYERLIETMIVSLAASGVETEAEIRARCEADPLVLGSIRSTLRAPVGRGFNRMRGGGIRHGTGNECEDRWMRFYQKGGDGEVDTNPIAMLSKGEVFQLGLAVGVPAATLLARPSPDLWAAGDDHNDEDEIKNYLGVSLGGHSFYSYIDLETGAYKNVGLIERVCRILDLPSQGGTVEDDLFRGAIPVELVAASVVGSAPAGPLLSDELAKLLGAARRVERATRHKMNPNCPSLGLRGPMVAAGLLTDTLPEV